MWDKDVKSYLFIKHTSELSAPHIWCSLFCNTLDEWGGGGPDVYLFHYECSTTTDLHPGLVGLRLAHSLLYITAHHYSLL